METTKVLRARAAAGDADAIFRLGYRLAYGRKRKRPEPWREIERLWRRALALGQSRANLHLGRLYLDGGIRDPRRAVKHYVGAALAGYIAAQYELGCMYRDGNGVRVDAKDAISWFSLGAASGHDGCMNEMGRALHEGIGVRRNRRDAVRYYRRAARLGNEIAMHNLALCYHEGSGVARSPRWARHWMHRSAALGFRQARCWLARQPASTEGRPQ